MIRALLAVLFAGLLASGCGEKRTPEPVPGGPALWVVEDESRRPAGWLFGTIHALPNGARWRTPVLERVVGQAGVLVVEVRDLDPAAIAAALARLAHDRPGPPLVQRLPAGQRDDLTELLASEGVPAKRFDELETWAAALALAQAGNDQRVENGADRALLAQFARRPVEELEGAADQLAIFDRLSERDQRTMLAAVISERERAGEFPAALADAWLAGDTARLERLARAGLLADPALYEALLAKRNRGWMAKIVPLIERGRRPLVAVGAAHMLGPDGLPALLAAEGYRVRRIK